MSDVKKPAKPRLRYGEYVFGKRHTNRMTAWRALVRACRQGRRGRMVCHRDGTFSLVMYA